MESAVHVRGGRKVPRVRRGLMRERERERERDRDDARFVRHVRAALVCMESPKWFGCTPQSSGAQEPHPSRQHHRIRVSLPQILEDYVSKFTPQKAPKLIT